MTLNSYWNDQTHRNQTAVSVRQPICSHNLHICVAPPLYVQDTAHTGTVMFCSWFDAQATNFIFITQHSWFRLTVQWDDPPFGVCSFQLMGVIFMHSLWTVILINLLYFYRSALSFRSGYVVWTCTKRVKYFIYHKHIILHKINI